MCVGIANPIPSYPPLSVAMAVLIPMTSPRMLISGPPLFPGLMAASVCKKSARSVIRLRPLALIIPAVTDMSSPNGLPIARTQSPTSTARLSPNRIGFRSEASMRTMATSVRGSDFTSLATNSRPSCNRTLTSSAPLTTWLFVRMTPFASMINPEPID